MRKAALLASTLIWLLAACASPSPVPPAPVVVEPPRLPDLPAAVMAPREANFRDRLLRILPPWPTTPTR